MRISRLNRYLVLAFIGGLSVGCEKSNPSSAPPKAADKSEASDSAAHAPAIMNLSYFECGKQAKNTLVSKSVTADGEAFDTSGLKVFGQEVEVAQDLKKSVQGIRMVTFPKETSYQTVVDAIDAKLGKGSCEPSTTSGDPRCTTDPFEADGHTERSYYEIVVMKFGDRVFMRCDDS